MHRAMGSAAILCLALAFSCARAPRGPIDPTLASCIPPDAIALAGVNLDQLRASPLYAKLPPGASAFLQPLREASYVLAAYNGKDVLAVARGAFHEAPPGATLLAGDLAITGSPAAVRAAQAQRQTGRPGAPWLMERAATAANNSQIWVAAQGGATFPLTGDAANVNRFLALAESISLTVRLDAAVHLEAAAACRTPDDARQLEENLRAFLTFAARGAGKDRGLATLLSSIQVERNGLAVRAAVTANPDEAGKLIP
ncbi:MAG TPA: hypothetical protein VMU19_01940 [Bryobacteraceae bacterium]|nr:hypothetical protein [Bryobacteraceae bacterium]